MVQICGRFGQDVAVSVWPRPNPGADAETVNQQIRRRLVLVFDGHKASCDKRSCLNIVSLGHGRDPKKSNAMASLFLVNISSRLLFFVGFTCQPSYGYRDFVVVVFNSYSPLQHMHGCVSIFLPRQPSNRRASEPEPGRLSSGICSTEDGKSALNVRSIMRGSKPDPTGYENASHRTWKKDSV